MLGLADRGLAFDLLEHLARGRIKEALSLYAEMHQGGADALALTQDLLELTHALTRMKVIAGASAPDLLPEASRARAATLAEAMSVAALTRLWQMLLKGVGEVQHAPDAKAALEMLMVRLAFVADLPSPAEMVKRLGSTGGEAGAASAAPSAPVGAVVATARPLRVEAAGEIGAPTALAGGGAPALARRAEPAPIAPAAPSPSALPDPRSFEAVVELFGARREALLRTQLAANVHLVHFEPGRLEFRPEPAAPRDLASKVGDLLSQWTGRRWVVSIASAGGAPTLHEQQRADTAQRHEAAASHPLIRAVLDAFPGATIQAVRDLTPDEPVAADTTDEPDEPGESGEPA
jgi:DNA polymerase-3 subunit gamma/tau